MLCPCIAAEAVKKIGPEDGDSAGALAYKKKRLKHYRRVVCVFECFSFNSILEYMKIWLDLPNVFCFFKIGQHDPFYTIIDTFYFVLKEFRCLWVLSPRI